MVGPLTDEQRMMIDTMRKHTLTMTSLLNNVITIAGLETGTLNVRDRADRAESGARRYALVGSRAVGGQRAVAGRRRSRRSARILADAQQLRGALQQLLDNARRYTDAGTISIRASQQDNLVRVDVSDTGRGIGSDLCEQLFTRFTRGSEGINSAERGIGLGLAIARQLIERQGGALWLESTSEHGSIFSLTLPCSNEAIHHTNDIIATAA